MGNNRPARSWNSSRVERGHEHGSHQMNIRPRSLDAIGTLEERATSGRRTRSSAGQMRRGNQWVGGLVRFGFAGYVGTVFP